MKQSNSLVTVEELSLSIGNEVIVEKRSFEIFEGEKVALSGPSGSGKTLLAYCISNLLSNKFKVHAKTFKSNPLHEIGFVFQEPQVALNPLMSVGKQIKEVLELYYSERIIEDKLNDLLIDLNLPLDTSFLNAFPHELSGGQQQRVVIGMAIAKNPKLLIADEPTTSLDSKTTVEIMELIIKLVNKKNRSLLLITHDQKIIHKYCDREISLVQKNNKREGAPSIDMDFIGNKRVKKGAIILELENISLYLRRRKTDYSAIIKNLSAKIYRGEVIGLIGKSGSGKSSLSKIIAGLIDVDNGKILNYSKRFKIQLVQQDPFQSLNPSINIRNTIGEVIKCHFKSYKEGLITEKISSLLKEVGLSDQYLNRKPTELSGGERQRIAIARSLAVDPEVLICDESVSSLDQVNQQKIIDLLIDLNKNRGMAILFITHDLSLVGFCDNIWVLDKGEIVEKINEAQQKIRFSSKAGIELYNAANFF